VTVPPEVEEVAPVQEYVFAPLAFSVAVVPEQTVGEFTTIVGIALIVTVAVAEPVQLFKSVPVTVY
jgi:hypothetical protein